MEVLDHTDTGSVLVFTRTKHRAKRVAEQLEKVGFSVTSLQGNLSQNRRQAALEGFRDGKYQVMVATDIAARGIDVSQISHVINYDIPDTTDAYTHRIGRTGRAAKTGDAFTFVTNEDAETVRAIERVLGSRIERRTLQGFDYSQPAPARNAEFARPPREPQRRRTQAAPEYLARPEPVRGQPSSPAPARRLEPERRSNRQEQPRRGEQSSYSRAAASRGDRRSRDTSRSASKARA
jgi:superfamily II DNA/RNA helicase